MTTSIIETLKLVKVQNPKATNAQLRAVLKGFGFDQDKIDAEIAPGTRNGFTQTDTLKAIEEGITETELFFIILDAEAKNEARWIGDRNRIRKTVNAVYANLGSPVEEAAATDAQKEAVKALVATK